MSEIVRHINELAETLWRQCNFKTTAMKQTVWKKIVTGRTTSQRKEVLFFADPLFLIFNFTADTHLAHFVLPQTHKPTQAKQKEPNFSNAQIRLI